LATLLQQLVLREWWSTNDLRPVFAGTLSTSFSFPPRETRYYTDVSNGKCGRLGRSGQAIPHGFLPMGMFQLRYEVLPSSEEFIGFRKPIGMNK